MGTENLLAFVLLALLTAISLQASQWIYKNILAPLGLFLAMNLGSLSLWHLKLLPLAPIILEAYTLIFASLFAFLAGCLLASPFFIREGKPLPRELCCGGNFEKKSLGLTIFYYLTAIFGIVGWAFFVTVVVPPGWWARLWTLQGEYTIPYHLGYLMVAGSLTMPTFVLLTLARRKMTLTSIFFLVSNVLTLALCGIKSYLVIGLASSLLVWSTACPGRIRMKHLLVAAICIVGFMALYDRFIDVFVPKSFPGSRFPTTLHFLERPYLYIVGPWSAMSVVMADPPAQAHRGQVTLLPLWKLLGPGGLGLMERVPKYLPFVDIGPSMFNTYSLIGEVYWDFGWLGAILICFLLGFISTTLYLRARKHRDWIMYLLSAVFSYGLFISFFAYYYRDNLVFLLLYTVVVGTLAKRVSRAWRRFMYLLGRQHAMVKADSIGGGR